MGAFLPPHCWFLLFFGKRTHSLGCVLHEGEFFVWSGYTLSSFLQFVRKNRIKDISTASSIAQRQDEQVFLLNLEELTPHPLRYKEYWHCHSVFKHVYFATHNVFDVLFDKIQLHTAKKNIIRSKGYSLSQHAHFLESCVM